ncbi:MAG TPA: hypothetical protein VH142_20765 [Polyangiaceae bacterium]|jgi:hypothetical protein|nr:hypothetical protein [Polyangiaceae bacterium]
MRRVTGSLFALWIGVNVLGCGSSEQGGTLGGHGSASGAGASDAGDSDGAAASGNGGGSGGGFSTGSGGAGGTLGTGGGAANGGSGSVGGAATGGHSGAGGVSAIDSGNACVSTKVQATNQPLDLFIMQDRSGSMKDATSSGDTKWTVITDAIGAFVADKASTGIGAGIAFFGIPTGTGDDSSCTVADYAKPVVSIAALPGNATKITSAITGESPSGNTPTQPALQGALNYAKAWSKAHPTHKVIVVFATDGLPNGCNSTVAGAATIATTGRTAAPAVSTYVIGVFGSKDCPNGLTQQCTVVDNTNAIAKGGGTGSAFIVDTSGNAEAQFLAAMTAIRAANDLGCAYAIPKAPSGKTVDLGGATVEYTPSGKAERDLKNFASAAACKTADGWYYGSNKINLCPTTCTSVSGDAGAKIEILLACQDDQNGSGGASGAGGNAGSSGAGGTAGAGGTSGAGGTAGSGGAGGASSCLLSGQSCATDGDCCQGFCLGGVCGTIQ